MEIIKIAVVIPCYRVKSHILEVISSIGSEVACIYVVDDCCPEKSGNYVTQNCKDPRVQVIQNTRNLGVGGATLRGYAEAIDHGNKIVVKIDGDGQMDPALISEFVAPIIAGEADYTKGNRFYDLEAVRSMPSIRFIGNAILSIITKISCGYWDLFDPTNGYTAIHGDVIRKLPVNKISNRYFFESDVLFRLNIMRAVVVDIPMEAKYGGEKSNLKISKTIFEFSWKHTKNFFKRIFYNYYLRDMSIASIELAIGSISISFGVIFGLNNWMYSASFGKETPAGTVMLSGLPIIIGFQLVLAFLNYDISAVPTRPIHKIRKLSVVYKSSTK